MRSNAPPNCSLHDGAQSLTCPAVPPHFGRRMPQWQMAATALLGMVLASNAFCGPPAGVSSHDSTRRDSTVLHAFTILAQADAPASIFSPWSDQDVRQGMPSRPDVRVAPREFAQTQPAAMPKDVRRSSAASADAIPVFRKSNRDELEYIRLGSRPDGQRAASGSSGTTRQNTRDSFITLQPFSDADLRQGSRRSASAPAQAGNIPDKPITVPADKDKRGFFGRALEKIGL
jgi:hypothetical protein